MDVSKFFRDLRFDADHHLGMGDIRLTMAQQEEIVDFVENLIKEHDSRMRYEITQAFDSGALNSLRSKPMTSSEYFSKRKEKL